MGRPSKKKPSEVIEQELSTEFYWWRKFYNCAWNSKQLHTDQGREVRRQVEAKMFEIKTLLREHYTPIIGKARVSELEG